MTDSIKSIKVFVPADIESMKVQIPGHPGPAGPPGSAAMLSPDPANVLTVAEDGGVIYRGLEYSSTNW